MSVRSREVAKTRRLSPGLLIIVIGAIILVKAFRPDLLTQQKRFLPDGANQADLEQATTLPPTVAESGAPAQEGNFTRNQPARLVIASLGIDAPIQPVGLVPVIEDGELYYQWQVPDGPAVGWHKISARLGEPGNTVLNGHNNVYGQVFRELAFLEVGAEVVVYDAEGSSHTYIVTQNERVAEFGQPLAARLENARWIQPSDEEQITLVSCWPYASNTHRVIVTAEPVELANS